MNRYEVVFIGRQDLSQQQIEALGVNLGLFVTQNGGEVVRSEYCGFRNLAYQIKKNHKGHYYIIQMISNADTMSELTRMMNINEDIIRSLVVKVDEFENKDNLISQAKTANDEFTTLKDSGYRSHKAEASDDDVDVATKDPATNNTEEETVNEGR